MVASTVIVLPSVSFVAYHVISMALADIVRVATASLIMLADVCCVVRIMQFLVFLKENPSFVLVTFCVRCSIKITLVEITGYNTFTFSYLRLSSCSSFSNVLHFVQILSCVV